MNLKIFKKNIMTNKKRVFIICSVRNISNEYQQKLEKDNCIVHLPHRDTN